WARRWPSPVSKTHRGWAAPGGGGLVGHLSSTPLVWAKDEAKKWPEDDRASLTGSDLQAVLSNSPDPSGESLNSSMMQAKFHALMEMIKSLQQQMVYGRPDTTSVPSAASAGVSLPMTVAALTPDMAPIAHHPQATSQPHPSPTLRAPNLNGPLALHLQVQSISDGFSIPEMAIFGPTSDPTGHVVNCDIHMNLCTTSEGLICRAFPATLDE
ncbi:hypothetical protein ACLOJK_038628, partial [Asimina triloba]